MSAIHFSNLTLASTVHNNLLMSKSMIESFLENVGTPSEILLVDDASITPVKESDYGFKARILRNDTAKGFCMASDRALREVRTDYALLVDADVLFLRGDFAGGLAAFCEETSLAWCGFKQMNMAHGPQGSYETQLPPPWIFGLGNQATSFWSRFVMPEAKPTAGKRFAKVAAAHSSCAMVKLAIFRKIGGFDPWYWQCESDIELSLRFAQQGYKVAVDLGYTVCHEGSGGKTGGANRILDLYRAKLHLYEQFHPSCKFYLRRLLWCRHLLEISLFIIAKHLFRKNASDKISIRKNMLKTVLNGYYQPPK